MEKKLPVMPLPKSKENIDKTPGFAQEICIGGGFILIVLTVIALQTFGIITYP